MGRPARVSNYTTQTFSDRLSDLVKEKIDSGLTQKEVASGIGVASGTLSEWCLDQKTPTIDAIPKLASYFKVSGEWLLGLSDAKTLDVTLQGIHRVTGLSEGAIRRLIYLRSGAIDATGCVGGEFSRQRLELYSAFICNLEIFGLTCLFPANIWKIEEQGMSEEESIVFQNEEQAINFHRFEASQAILRFIEDFINSYRE